MNIYFGENVAISDNIIKTNKIKIKQTLVEKPYYLLFKYRKKLLARKTKYETLLEEELIYNKILYLPQTIIHPYIVDFLLPDKKTIIELDGEYHSSQEAVAYDNRRTNYLEQYGFSLLRYKNDLTISNMNDIITDIINIKSDYNNFNYTTRILNLIECGKKTKALELANRFITL